MKKEIIEKFVILITTAFGLIAALAWNEAIQSIFKKYFVATGTILARLVYAVIVTIIAVATTLWIGKIAEKSNPVEEKKEILSIIP